MRLEVTISFPFDEIGGGHSIHLMRLELTITFPLGWEVTIPLPFNEMRGDHPLSLWWYQKWSSHSFNEIGVTHSPSLQMGSGNLHSILWDERWPSSFHLRWEVIIPFSLMRWEVTIPIPFMRLELTIPFSFDEIGSDHLHCLDEIGVDNQKVVIPLLFNEMRGISFRFPMCFPLDFWGIPHSSQTQIITYKCEYG